MLQAKELVLKHSFKVVWQLFTDCVCQELNPLLQLDNPLFFPRTAFVFFSGILLCPKQLTVIPLYGICIIMESFLSERALWRTVLTSHHIIMIFHNFSFLFLSLLCFPFFRLSSPLLSSMFPVPLWAALPVQSLSKAFMSLAVDGPSVRLLFSPSYCCVPNPEKHPHPTRCYKNDWQPSIEPVHVCPPVSSLSPLSLLLSSPGEWWIRESWRWWLAALWGSSSSSQWPVRASPRPSLRDTHGCLPPSSQSGTQGGWQNPSLYIVTMTLYLEWGVYNSPNHHHPWGFVTSLTGLQKDYIQNNAFHFKSQYFTMFYM